MTPNDAFEFFVELVSQLFHADVLVAEGERKALEAEVSRLRAALSDSTGAAA